MRTAPANYRFLGITALVFLASAVATIAWCGSMSGMGGMPMPGGWTMSMTWMRMPGQTWSGAAATFLGMWSVMMLAMMLPAVTPALLRYRRSLGAAPAGRRRQLTCIAVAGYLLVWTMLGAACWPVGIALAELEMRFAPLAQAVPAAAGVVLLAAGLAQLSAWKSRQLACCRSSPARAGSGPGIAGTWGDAWRLGVRLGVRCGYCCAPLMVPLFVFGIMDLRAMAAVTVAVCLERLLPRGERLARLSGLAIGMTGLAIIVDRV